MRTPIVAFEFSHDALLAGEPLRLEDGLTVLYGANGAGKTRLLRGLKACLSGVATDVDMAMIVAARESDEAAEGARAGFSARSVNMALAEVMLPGPDEGEWDRRDRGDPLNPMTAAARIDHYITSQAGSSDRAFLREVLESRLFMLVPTGTEDLPAWDAWPVADLAQPEARRVASLLAESAEAWLDADHAAVESGGSADAEFDAYQDALWEHALIPPEEGSALARGRQGHVSLRSYAMYDIERILAGDWWPGIELRGRVDFGVDFVDVDADTDTATQAHFADLAAAASGAPWQRAPWRGLAGDGGADDVDVEDVVRRAADILSREVTQALSDVMLDAPVATLHVSAVDSRFARKPLEWRFYRTSRDAERDQAGDGPGAGYMRLDGLSRAERLWAERVILDALYWQRRNADPSTRQAVYLLDEPESALHRAAEAHMAASVVARAGDPRRIMVVATHSPELLDATSAHVIEVQRGAADRGRSRVRPLTFDDRSDLANLGLTPSDLLRWPKVFVLVEGMHDEVLLEHFLGPRLRRARAQILMLHGGTKLPHTINSQILFQFTRAHVIGVVDNQRAEVLAQAWQEAQEIAATGHRSEAIDQLRVRINDRSEESGFILSWLAETLRQDDRGLDGRLSPYGLSAKDVIEYLPVDRFVPHATSWADLHEQHAEMRTRKANIPKDFKKWLASAFGTSISPETLREAALGLEIPQDFERLMKEIEARSAAVAR